MTAVKQSVDVELFYLFMFSFVCKLSHLHKESSSVNYDGIKCMKHEARQGHETILFSG